MGKGNPGRPDCRSFVLRPKAPDGERRGPQRPPLGGYPIGRGFKGQWSGIDPLLPFRMGLYERARSARNRSSAEGVGCARIWRQYYRQAPEKRMVSSPKRRNKPYRYACGRAL